jgi:hypothetical protein
MSTATKLATVFLVALGIAGAVPVFAQHVPVLSTQEGFGVVPSFEGIPDSAGGFDLVGILQTIVNVFLAIVGIVAVIVIIIAGFRLVISGGDEDALRAARQQILYAVIGLLVIVLSVVIVNFVIGLIPGR